MKQTLIIDAKLLHHGKAKCLRHAAVHTAGRHLRIEYPSAVVYCYNLFYNDLAGSFVHFHFRGLNAEWISRCQIAVTGRIQHNSCGTILSHGDNGSAATFDAYLV